MKLQQQYVCWSYLMMTSSSFMNGSLLFHVFSTEHALRSPQNGVLVGIVRAGKWMQHYEIPSQWQYRHLLALKPCDENLFTCPCLGSQEWQVAGQSGHQGHGAPAKFESILKALNLQRKAHWAVLKPNQGTVTLQPHHLSHILVDQDDVNVIPANEALEGVLRGN